MTDGQPRQPARSGPTLYLESSEIDLSEALCTEVFADTDESEYRVVQVTATQSFESVRDALDARLEQINDPSEAAVIITTPQAEEDAEVTEVGDQTPLYGFRVSPDDLTGISIAFSQLIEKWEQEEGQVKICLRDIESLLPYHETELVYRFLNTVLATLQGAGADVHAHLQPDVADEQALQLFRSLFESVVDQDASTLETGSASKSDAKRERSAGTPGTKEGAPSESTDRKSSSGSLSSARMSAEEIDAFLEREGYGTLAFSGEPPYAVPISYGYDADKRVLFMHMAAFDGSEKQSRLEESMAVSLVVSRYERPDKWRSVIVDGSVSRLSNEEIRDRDGLSAFAESEMASVDIFTRDLANLDFDWYVLEPTSISGRRSVGSM
ncbi:pyridoxamine 5'-phosphate oxidase family protein [Halobellus ordinarius]|uniref:pyridoxamine 5'-phosphate oxidase family protein n=1 Tax=Halobellus ordinarius TaxID=3075120 RepID=UPI0028805241|nr:pyridoxamine 5'-phosphate oxidase family protein [Halobellus sp. ZY16]